MAGLGVVVLVVTLGVLATVIARPARAARAAPARGARAALVGRRAPAARRRGRAPLLDLLRSVVNDEEWDMFGELGFICVTGRRGRRPGSPPDSPPRYRYLIYPHLPVVALLPALHGAGARVLRAVPRPPAAPARPLLPGGDDVLAKWMTLRADEDRLLSYANVGNAGCQVPLCRIERDSQRLERWSARRAREAQNGGSDSPAGGSPGAGGSPSAVSSSIRR